MSDDYLAKVRVLQMEKACAIAGYGESVAAFRYRTLMEKTDSKQQQEVFSEMATEEQGHHRQIQSLIKSNFPGSDFVLSPEDKELVIVGPRMLEIHDRASFQLALEQIIASERLTGRFYDCLFNLTTIAELKPFLREMADECIEHAKRLEAIPQID